MQGETEEKFKNTEKSPKLSEISIETFEKLCKMILEKVKETISRHSIKLRGVIGKVEKTIIFTKFKKQSFLETL